MHQGLSLELRRAVRPLVACTIIAVDPRRTLLQGLVRAGIPRGAYFVRRSSDGWNSGVSSYIMARTPLYPPVPAHSSTFIIPPLISEQKSLLHAHSRNV